MKRKRKQSNKKQKSDEGGPSCPFFILFSFLLFLYYFDFKLNISLAYFVKNKKQDFLF